jgi:hypothetical protein
MKRSTWKYIIGATVFAGWTVLAIVIVYPAVQNAWFLTPDVVLTPRSQPGPTIEYDPSARVLAFEIAFTAENTSKEDEVIVATRGSLDSGAGALIYFVTTDVSCMADGVRFSSIAADSQRRIRCRLVHSLTSTTAGRLRAPGPLMLHVRFQGQRKAIPSVRYCINATDSFWRDFLGSRVKTTRLILNPEGCQ